MQAGNDVGPELVICGAARAGTSFLASLIGSHPAVDPGAVKEPNFFSREFDRGIEWYDGLFDPRQRGLNRLDASMSYTFAHFPDAMRNLATLSPEAIVVYSVREPMQRLLSHYQLHRDYFRNESAKTLGRALTGANVYSGASDYARWLDTLYASFPAEKVILAPFDVVTGRPREVVDLVCGLLHIDAGLIEVRNTNSQQHRNEVVEFRHGTFRNARRVMRQAGLYPWLRRTVGEARMRRLRTRVTRTVSVEDLSQALASCERTQLTDLDHLYTSAQAAVAAALEEQDARLGLAWAPIWQSTCPARSPDLYAQLEARR